MTKRKTEKAIRQSERDLCEEQFNQILVSTTRGIKSAHETLMEQQRYVYEEKLVKYERKYLIYVTVMILLLLVKELV